MLNICSNKYVENLELITCARLLNYYFRENLVFTYLFYSTNLIIQKKKKNREQRVMVYESIQKHECTCFKIGRILGSYTINIIVGTYLHGYFDVF